MKLAKSKKKKHALLDKSHYAIWWVWPHAVNDLLKYRDEKSMDIPMYLVNELEKINEQTPPTILIPSRLDFPKHAGKDLNKLHEVRPPIRENDTGIVLWREDVPALQDHRLGRGSFSDLDGKLYRWQVEGKRDALPVSYYDYVIWWLTSQQVATLLTAFDVGRLKLPSWLVDTLTRIDHVRVSDDCLIFVPPNVNVLPNVINNLGICPDREWGIFDNKETRQGILLPYRSKVLVEPLVGFLTDLLGSDDLPEPPKASGTDILGKAQSAIENILTKWEDKLELYVNRETTFKDYLIWWLTDKDAKEVLLTTVNKHATVPLYVLPDLCAIAHEFCGGLVHVPVHLLNPPYSVNVDLLDALEVESPDVENMRDGVLILKDDLDHIRTVTGIFTNVTGDVEEKSHPLVLSGHEAEKYVIWWLNDVELRIINTGIRDGSVKLPGYLIKCIQGTEDQPCTGQVVVPDCVTLDLYKMTEIIEGENQELTGYVVPREDMNCINKYCGRITDVDLRTTEPSWEEFNKTPYTEEEIRAMFIGYLQEIIKYWVGVHPNDSQQAVEGAVFSTLTMLDGSTMDVPGFLVIPHIQPDDNDFNAQYGFRPYPVAPAELVGKAVDIAGELHSALSRPVMDVIRCKNHITKKQWQDGLATQRWAYICEVMLRETPFVHDRFAGNHPGMVLGEFWRGLCMICLKNGALFITEDYQWADADYSFKWATDDAEVFDNMINDLSGYVLRTHF